MRRTSHRQHARRGLTGGTATGGLRACVGSPNAWGGNRPTSEKRRKFWRDACRRKRRTPPRRVEGPEIRGRRMQRLEAVLFLAKEPLPTRKIAQLANLADGTEARTLVRSLNRLYDAAHRAFRVEEVAGGYELVTRPKFADWIRRLGGSETDFRLSSPALETLAIIAYRQPITRADVEAIRGVSCGEIIRQLMDRDLVQIKGRSEELGRPFLYSTTRHFLRTFGFRGLEDLPRSQEFRGGPDPTDGAPSEPSHDDKETTVSTVIAPLTQLMRPELDPNAQWDELAVPAAPIAQAPPIEDEEDDLYEGKDEEGLDVDVDDDEEDDDWDEDFDDEDDDDDVEEDDLDDDLDDDDDDDDLDDDDDDDDENPWEEVEDDDIDEEEDDLEDEEDDDWDDDDEEDDLEDDDDDEED